KKYLKYETFKNETLTDIFTSQQLKNALELKVFELRSAVAINDGKGKFTLNPLPLEAQFSPLYGIEIGDFDKDGLTDILTGGNLFRVKPEVGRYDGSYGLLLKGDGKGNFRSLPPQQSGIHIEGEVRDILTLNTRKGTVIIFSRNNDAVKVYTMQ
ncbi:MAG: VCBS repeat-containing protein, partial [Cyclobacteriaceae bacterium]